MWEIISDIVWVVLLIILIIRIHLIEKEVENIKSWEMFAKICAIRFRSDEETESEVE